MGTIPGAIIECNVGDTLRIHFRNLDTRTKNIPAPWERAGSGELLPAAARAHSLHAHGLTFPSKYDGAFPLSPPDPEQLITTKERNQWIEIGVTGRYKQGDRVPAGAGRSRMSGKLVGLPRLAFGRIMTTPFATWRMSVSVRSG